MQEQHEVDRLRALRSLNLLDTPHEERFDRVVRLAQRLFDVPTAAVTLIDADRQWAKAQVGLPRQLPRDDSFCTHTIETPDPLVVQDTWDDDRFRDNPLVVDGPKVRFYAGQPLTVRGQRLGALCILDDKPREVTEADLDLLRDLASWVEKEFALDQELLRAGEVQRRLLPRSAPDLPGYQVAGRCTPAHDVGGDFYDWYHVGDRVQLVLADVMGKGVGAAIIAAGVRAVIRGAAHFNELEEAVNRAAMSIECDLGETSTFVTLFCAQLSPTTGEVRFVDAGHGLALVLDGRGGHRRLLTGDLPLGVLPGQTWTAGTTTLAPGETLVMVSDGLLDVFPDTRSALRRLISLDAASADADDLVGRIAALSLGGALTDDVTTVVVRRDTPEGGR